MEEVKGVVLLFGVLIMISIFLMHSIISSKLERIERRIKENTAELYSMQIQIRNIDSSISYVLRRLSNIESVIINKSDTNKEDNQSKKDEQSYTGAQYFHYDPYSAFNSNFNPWASNPFHSTCCGTDWSGTFNSFGFNPFGQQRYTGQQQQNDKQKNNDTKKDFHYFEGYTTKKAAKSLYRQYCKRLHPDQSTGNKEEFEKMQAQYNSLL